MFLHVLANNDRERLELTCWVAEARLERDDAGEKIWTLVDAAESASVCCLCNEMSTLSSGPACLFSSSPRGIGNGFIRFPGVDNHKDERRRQS